MSQPQRSHPYANDFFYDAEQPPATTRPQLSTSYPERPIQISAPYPFTRARSFPSAEWTSIPSPWSAPLSASATQTSFAQVQALPSRSSMSHVPTYLSDQLRNNVDTLDSPIDAQPVPIPSSSTQVYHDVYYGTQIPSQHIMGSSSLPSVYGDPPTHNGPGPYSTPGYPAQDLAPSSVTCVPPTFFDYSMPASAPMQHPAQWNTQSFGPGQLGPFNAIAPTATQATVAIPSSYSSTPLPASSSSTSANFRRSESSADRSSKQFKCDICPQSFNRNHDLKRHKVR